MSESISFVKRLLFSGAILLMTMMACRFSATTDAQTAQTTQPAANNSADARIYETDVYRFEVPKTWRSYEEIWGPPAQHNDNFYGLGLQEEITFQYPPEKGKGIVFFSVASSPLAGGADLKSRFDAAYENPLPEIKEVSGQLFKQGTLAGYEISYQRPWGEPWWKFRDIWLEHNNSIYVLSWHTSAGSFDTYRQTFEQILNSFDFKN